MNTTTIVRRLCDLFGFARSGERDVEVFGYAMRLDLAEAIQREIYWHAFEPEETAWVRDFLRPGMTFVDVGANVGYFTLLAARQVGERGRVVSFEPSPYAVGRLRDVVARNRLSNVSVVAAGLGDKAGSIALVLQDHGCHSPSLVPKTGIPLGSVSILRLDDFLDEHGIASVDLVKIDVEGFEPNVIRGASRAFEQRRIGAILCELYDDWLVQNESGADRLMREILDFGFEAKRTSRHAQYANVLFVRK